MTIKLERGEFDFAISSPPLINRSSKPFLIEEEIFSLYQTHRFASLSKISLSQVSDEPFITFKSDCDIGLTDEL